jgi:hypothetical protein
MHSGAEMYVEVAGGASGRASGLWLHPRWAAILCPQVGLLTVWVPVHKDDGVCPCWPWP